MICQPEASPGGERLAPTDLPSAPRRMMQAHESVIRFLTRLCNAHADLFGLRPEREIGIGCLVRIGAPGLYGKLCVKNGAVRLW